VRIPGLVLLIGLNLTAAAVRGAVVRVETEPSGFDVWADGRYLGRTPAESVLPEGKTKLTVAAASESLFFAPSADTILTVSDAETLTVRIAVARNVSVRSQPFNLPLMRDGRQIGRTPLEFPLDTRRPGKIDLMTSSGPVPVPADSLLASGSWFWRGPSGPSDAVSGGTPSLVRRVGRYVMPGLAVALAVSATLAKDSADHSFADYETTADPGEISRYFDEARRKDELATVFWVGVEVCVISSIVAWILPEHKPQHPEEERP
jgi:hypothetical protein